MSKLTNKITRVDFFKDGQDEKLFVGRPYAISYNRANLLISDYWKYKVKGIPEGSFLLAFYDNPYDEEINEALLLRVLKPAPLPTDNNVISSMVEYYKDNLNTSGKKSDLDDFTKYEFSFSGLECRILGTFYIDQRNGKQSLEFGADVENFYSAHNYKVFKATGKVLEHIVNQRDKDLVAGGEHEFGIGCVRYSSSRRFTTLDSSVSSVPVFINPGDLLGKRTALFGMTRTGKSNTVKKIIEASVEISSKATRNLKADEQKLKGKEEQLLTPIDEEGKPKYAAGQIIFDINGEYANPNLQDKGTAIFELYEDKVTRFSVLEKPGFKVMKVNFYEQPASGFSLIESHFRTVQENSDYVSAFRNISLELPDDYATDKSVQVRYDRKVAAYLCCLHRANFPADKKFKVKFSGFGEINDEIGIDPAKGVDLESATNWFKYLWENYEELKTTTEYPRKHQGREWADEELKSILVFLTQRKTPTGNPSVSGYKKLTPLVRLHTSVDDEPFEKVILEDLRDGKIVIIDLSQGESEIQRLYSEKICREIFTDAMSRFVENLPNNFIQFYFEEAHNLFPKKEDKDLSQIYNRLAKEGAKLHLGMIYATQEVSSISSNILKNTQNWFIAHLNNEDETRELRKYYDFADFTESLVRFSAKSDKGFVRMKTYSNPFVVPVQVDQFLANK